MFYWKSYKWQLYFCLDRKERLAIISLSYIYPHTDFSCYSLIIPLIQLKQNTNIPQFLCYEDNNRPKAWIECIFSVHTALAKPVTWQKTHYWLSRSPQHAEISEGKQAHGQSYFNSLQCSLYVVFCYLTIFLFQSGQMEIHWPLCLQLSIKPISHHVTLNVMSHRVSWLISLYRLSLPAHNQLLFLIETYFILFMFSTNICKCCNVMLPNCC